MQIVLASGNKGKIKEIQALLPNDEVVPYSDILGAFEIEETGSTFKENAIIKAMAVDDALQKANYEKAYIVISDDSGITVPILGDEPGIYSARYAGVDATDTQNNQKLISKLKDLNIEKTAAYYTACICVVYNHQSYTTHGWMHGDVIDEQKGEGGFGYDPMFIPSGFSNTLGELEYEVKKSFSHRTKALKLAMMMINSLKPKR